MAFLRKIAISSVRRANHANAKIADRADQLGGDSTYTYDTLIPVRRDPGDARRVLQCDLRAAAELCQGGVHVQADAAGIDRVIYSPRNSDGHVRHVSSAELDVRVIRHVLMAHTMAAGFPMTQISVALLHSVVVVAIPTHAFFGVHRLQARAEMSARVAAAVDCRHDIYPSAVCAAVAFHGKYSTAGAAGAATPGATAGAAGAATSGATAGAAGADRASGSTDDAPSCNDDGARATSTDVDMLVVEVSNSIIDAAVITIVGGPASPVATVTAFGGDGTMGVRDGDVTYPTWHEFRARIFRIVATATTATAAATASNRARARQLLIVGDAPHLSSVIAVIVEAAPGWTLMQLAEGEAATLVAEGAAMISRDVVMRRGYKIGWDEVETVAAVPYPMNAARVAVDPGVLLDDFRDARGVVVDRVRRSLIAAGRSDLGRLLEAYRAELVDARDDTLDELIRDSGATDETTMNTHYGYSLVEPPSLNRPRKKRPMPDDSDGNARKARRRSNGERDDDDERTDTAAGSGGDEDGEDEEGDDIKVVDEDVDADEDCVRDKNDSEDVGEEEDVEDEEDV
jgi:hypothetical protein